MDALSKFTKKISSSEDITESDKESQLRKELLLQREKNERQQVQIDNLSKQLNELMQSIRKDEVIIPAARRQQGNSAVEPPLPSNNISTGEYDGSTDVSAFIDQIIRTSRQLDSDPTISALIRKVCASKLKGRAQQVVERHQVTTAVQLKECLETHFGKLELEYDQLSEIRNAMRQKSDGEGGDYKEMHRVYESNKAIEKFVRGLYPEGLRLAVQQKNPHTLPIAYQQAMYEEQRRNEDDRLRAKNRIDATYEYADQRKEREKRESRPKDRYARPNKHYSKDRYDSAPRERYYSDKREDNHHSRSREQSTDRYQSRDRTPPKVTFEKHDRPPKPTCSYYGAKIFRDQPQVNT
ncbi:nuclear speckle splicing regulatory protein 1-like [Phymastichus coffea]|uniref:nuclear speckle splicing regulatory protein 1-like n=1 Tax=Phymastichus coffea TaxID=108790 RepID=UPI00273C3EEA|nr:nuclear speckle splicing regulatory protein 1-like [Phymastichus coffea]